MVTETLVEPACVGPAEAYRAILHDPANELCLSHWAAHAGMNPSRFSRAFRAQYGIGFSAHRFHQRMIRAMKRLRDGDSPVTHICFDLGYSSLGTFTHRFSESVGCAPNMFRQLHHAWRGFLSGWDSDASVLPLMTDEGLYLVASSRNGNHVRRVLGEPLTTSTGRRIGVLGQGGASQLPLPHGVAETGQRVDYLLSGSRVQWTLLLLGAPHDIRAPDWFLDGPPVLQANPRKKEVAP